MYGKEGISGGEHGTKKEVPNGEVKPGKTNTEHVIEESEVCEIYFFGSAFPRVLSEERRQRAEGGLLYSRDDDFDFGTLAW